MNRKILACTVLSMFAFVPKSDAALMAAIDVNGVQACASDNNVGCTFGTVITDLDPTVGVMSFGNLPVVIGGLSVTGSVQQAVVGGAFNILNTSSTQITNVSGGTLTGTFAVSATDFTPPVSQAFVSGSATWQDAVGSAITMAWYNDPTNTQGADTAMDTPGIQLFQCSDSITLIADATACSLGPIPVSDLNPFSMTLYTQFTLVNGATMVNRGQTELKPVSVPEPTSLFLLALGFAAAARKIRAR